MSEEELRLAALDRALICVQTAGHGDYDEDTVVDVSGKFYDFLTQK